MKQEIWKDIPGWEGVYQISDNLNVRSLDHSVKIKNTKGKLISKKRKEAIRHKFLVNDTPIVSFRKDRYRYDYKVSDLYNAAFKGRDFSPFRTYNYQKKEKQKETKIINKLIDKIEDLYSKLNKGTIDESIKILSKINVLKLKLQANKSLESSKKQYCPDYIHFVNLRK